MKRNASWTFLALALGFLLVALLVHGIGKALVLVAAVFAVLGVSSWLRAQRGR